jgi:hypothetical protein
MAQLVFYRFKFVKLESYLSNDQQSNGRHIGVCQMIIDDASQFNVNLNPGTLHSCVKISVKYIEL